MYTCKSTLLGLVVAVFCGFVLSSCGLASVLLPLAAYAHRSSRSAHPSAPAPIGTHGAARARLGRCLGAASQRSASQNSPPCAAAQRCELVSARSGLGQPRRVAKLAASLDAAEACLAPDAVPPPAPPPGPTNTRPQMRSATPALDLLKEKLPAKGFERDAAVRHFHEVTAATSLNAAIFGAPGGALQKQLVASFDSCLTAVGELKARVASLEQSRDAAEKRASAAESRLNDTGKVTLDDLTDLRKSFEAPAQPNNDDLRERCRRAEARADEAVATIDGLRERLARAEEALSNLRATSDASSTELKQRCDDADGKERRRARDASSIGRARLGVGAEHGGSPNADDERARRFDAGARICAGVARARRGADPGAAAGGTPLDFFLRAPCLSTIAEGDDAGSSVVGGDG